MKFFPTNIVVADDDEDDFSFLENGIKAAFPEANISFVLNGLQLLLLLNRSKPDVIFLDINMPVKDGIECLKDIRRNAKNGEPRIVMFSTSTHTIDVDNSYLNGATFYMIKPSTRAALDLSIHRLFKDENFIANRTPARNEFVIGYNY
jgi:DNA-binding NarL/FixJ family response regulator